LSLIRRFREVREKFTNCLQHGRTVKERIANRIQKAPPRNAGLFPEDMELEVWDEIRDKLKEIDISSLTPLEVPCILRFLKNKSDKFE